MGTGTGKQVISDLSDFPAKQDVGGATHAVKDWLDLLAPLASPTFTGSPTVPGYAPLASPAFTGAPTGDFSAGSILPSGSSTARTLAAHLSGWINTTTATLAADATEAAAQGIGLLVARPVTITTAINLGAVPVRREGGGKFVVNTGGSLTGTGPLEAGLSLLFDTSGGGTVTFAWKVDVVYPQWWGALSDESHDDTTAVQAAFDAATSMAATWGSATVRTPPGINGKGYLITNTVILHPGASLDMAGGHFLYSGTFDRAALQIGDLTADTYAKEFRRIHVESAAGNTFTNEAYVGVKFERLVRSKVHIAKAGNFTISAQLWGTQVAYNTFFVGDLLNALVHLDVNCGEISSFINENVFIGGRYGNDSSYPAAVNSYGIRFTAASGAYHTNNNNVFLKPCFELTDGNVGVERIPWYINGAGIYNTIENARAENGRGPVLKCVGTTSGAPAYGNRMSLGYGAGPNLVQAPTNIGAWAYANVVTSSSVLAPNVGPSWDSGDLQSKAFGITSNTIAVKGLFTQLSSSTVSGYANFGEILFDSVSVTVSQGFGVYVDTSVFKQLVVQTHTKNGRGGRIGVVCYSSAGAILDNTGPNAPYAAGPGVGGTAAFGYIYRTGSDGANRITFSLGADVAYVKVIISGGSNPINLTRIQIGVPDITFGATGLRVWTGLGQDANSVFCSAKPDTYLGGGFAARGFPCLNGSAASGAPASWTATTAGWNAAAWVASTAYVVDQVRANGGNVYVVRVAGTAAGSGGPTGTGTGIVDGGVTWDYVGPAAVFATSPNLL